MTAAFWNEQAERYAAKPVADPDAFERKIAVTLARTRPSHTVLDIGCGTGSLALRLAPSAAQLHGLDISSEMVRIARGKAAAQQVDNVTFHVGPFDDSFAALAPGSLDGVCAYSILHLVDDREGALRRIFRLLKPGGFLVTSTVCLGETWVPFRPLLWAMRLVGMAPPVQILSKRQLAQDIEAAGFVDLEQPDVGAKAIVGFMVARKPG
ncbi:MAG: methyltransferase domain-containing protein [Myxococcales bacterium]|nr:methyltransferase domain-containing protein [Myxococcales bacterium]